MVINKEKLNQIMWNNVYILVSILLIAFYLQSCSTKQKTVADTSKYAEGPNQLKNIRHLWMVVSTESRETKINCNVCPTVNFTNNEAIVKFPSNEIEVYNWEIKSDTILFVYSSKNIKSETDDKYFDATYILKFAKFRDSIKLKLIALNGNYWCNLSRSR